MKKLVVIGVAVGLASLAACNNATPRENAADNIEANAEAVADNMEAAAGNAGAAGDSIQNRADAVRATGQNKAGDMRTHDADTNLANGL